MKALTVQQPWAWAIVYGGKNVENRTQLWNHRGTLAVHAGTRWSDRGARSRLVGAAYLDTLVEHGWQPVAPRAAFLNQFEYLGLPRDAIRPEQFGAVIGIVDLVDAHRALDGCCESPWAEYAYEEHGGDIRRDVTHLVLENPEPLAAPIPCRGALGLWTLPRHAAEVLA